MDDFLKEIQRQALALNEAGSINSEFLGAVYFLADAYEYLASNSRRLVDNWANNELQVHVRAVATDLQVDGELGHTLYLQLKQKD